MNKEIDINKNLLGDIRTIIENGRKQAYAVVGHFAVVTYWNIGKRIVEDEQNGKTRAEYGKQIIDKLAEQLTKEFGSNFSKRNLDYYRKFYLSFPNIEIVNTCVHNLDWSHFRRIMSVANPQARQWYVKIADEQMWSVRTLDRNISTQYYERTLANQQEGQSLPKAKDESSTPLDYLKNPIVAEFLGFRKDTKYDETTLEQALINNLEDFIMELGRGFSFVARQKHITTETDDFYIDLVFYNYKLKCFVLFELKTHKLSHQDIGQLDMYVRMYDNLVKDKSDNPTIGILLCSDTDSTIAKYSVLSDNNNLFAAKYMPFMPTEEELVAEIERQKQFFMLNQEQD